MNNPYFEILIYSCSQSQFLDHITKETEKDLVSAGINYGNGLWKQMRQKEIKRRLKPVRYNELIGSIEVYPFGSQLRADYSFTDKKRIYIGTKVKGIIKRKGKFLEKRYGHSKLTSPEIFRDFRDALERRVKESRRINSRYVDYSAFDKCGEFIDWRKILNL